MIYDMNTSHKYSNPNCLRTMTVSLLHNVMHVVRRKCKHSFLADGFNGTHGYLTILRTSDAKKSNNSLQNHKNTNHVQVQ